MKYLILASIAALQGCAGFVPYVQAHAVGIAAVGAVAGATGAVESVVLNTKALIENRPARP